MEINKEYVMKLLGKVIGEIRPCADAAIDGKRIENLKLFIDNGSQVALVATLTDKLE